MFVSFCYKIMILYLQNIIYSILKLLYDGILYDKISYAYIITVFIYYIHQHLT